MMPAKNTFRYKSLKNYRKKNHTLKLFALVVASYYPVYFTIALLVMVVLARYAYQKVIDIKPSRLYEPFVIYSHPYILDFNQYVEAPYDYRLVIPLDHNKEPLIAGNCIKLTKFNLEPDSIFINRPGYEIVESCSVPILERISQMRLSLIQNYQEYMKYPYSGIILGVTFGYKEEFTEEFRRGIRTSGLSHIFVVSGYNFSLLSLILRKLLSITGRYVYILCLLIIFLLYLAITGLNPPAVRAIIMSLMIAIASISGRVYSSLLILIYSGLVMLIFNPNYLFDLSFLLSFMSTLGLIASGYITTSRILSGIKEILFVNLFILPIVMHYFEEYSLIGIINNLIVLDLVPFLTALGFLNLFLQDPLTALFAVSIAKGIYDIVNVSTMILERFPSLILNLSNNLVDTTIFTLLIIISFILLFVIKWKYRVHS